MPGEGKPKADVVEPAQVREELRNVFASEAFKGGKRAQDFLQIVVEHALAGSFDNLRERMLGAEIFGRPVNYDTANDAVVRVKASEVRKRLAQYYQSLESPPAVRIDLPTGSYAPQFTLGAAAPAAPQSPVSQPGEAMEPPPPPTRRLRFGMSRPFVF